MSDKNKKSKSVFVEGDAVSITSPYDQYKNVELTYVEGEDNQPSLPTVPSEKRTIRLECLQLAVLSESNSVGVNVASVIDLAKRYYQFVKTGE